MGVVAQFYISKQYKDALQALSQLKTHSQVIVNQPITEVFNTALSIYQSKVLMKALNVIAVSCSAVLVSTVSESVGVPNDKLVGGGCFRERSC